MEAGVGITDAPLKLWIPGAGEVDLRVRRVMKAVEEYDSELRFGRHEITGDWVVLLERSPLTGKPHPLLGFGTELPSPERVVQRMSETDVRRRGSQMLRALTIASQAERDASDERTGEASGQAAEALEWGHRQMGTHPNPRIFVPGG